MQLAEEGKAKRPWTLWKISQPCKQQKVLLMGQLHNFSIFFNI